MNEAVDRVLEEREAMDRGFPAGVVMSGLAHLLLVFMVTAPMMSRGIDVSLPVANQPNITPEDRPVTVVVNARGTVYINDKPVALPLLEDQLRGRLQGMATKVVYLRADEALRYGKVIEVVDIMKHAGVEQIGFAYDLPEKAVR